MFIILGYGNQGRAITHYLVNHTNQRIETYDLRYFSTYVTKHRHTVVTKFEEIEISKYNNEETVVINCLPTEYSERIVNLCLNTGCHYIDLGGDINVTNKILKLHSNAQEKGVTLIPDCGIAPGLVSVLIQELENAAFYNVDIFCGGLPQDPSKTFLPLGYILSFSPKGVIKEYSGDVLYREDGITKTLPALSKKIHIPVPGLGILEGKPTSGSLSLTPNYSNLINLNYWTLRYAGHWDYIENAVLNNNNPEKYLVDNCPKVSSRNKDLLILGYHATGGADIHGLSSFMEQKWWRWDYDEVNNISAMAQITGYTAASIACMIYQKELPKGFFHLKDLNWKYIKERIEMKKNQFTEIRYD